MRVRDRTSFRSPYRLAVELHEGRTWPACGRARLTRKHERVRIHHSETPAPHPRQSAGSSNTGFPFFECQCIVARRDGVVPQGFGHGRDRRGFPDPR